MFEPTSRDEVCTLLLTDISMNRYDNAFIDNITLKYVYKGMGLSAKQNILFEEIVKKYRKQFSKVLQLKYIDLLKLPWQVRVVTDAELSSKNYFKIKDGKMCLYFNFNKDLISTVRSLVFDDACDFLNKHNNSVMQNEKYDFVWYIEDEEWRGDFNVYLFKELLSFARINKINIDDSVHDIEDKLNRYGSRDDWTPRFVQIHGRYYINNIAESMLPYLDDFDPIDTEHYAKYCNQLGIKPAGENEDIKIE